VLSDIGSGLNVSRKRLQHLLKLVCEYRVAEVAITYPDHFTRFGTEYLETLFSSFGVTFTLLDPTEEKTPQQELPMGAGSPAPLRAGVMKARHVPRAHFHFFPPVREELCRVHADNSGGRARWYGTSPLACSFHTTLHRSLLHCSFRLMCWRTIQAMTCSTNVSTSQ
jgi:hypothetical protein